jgi:hypothetical protein
LAERVTADRDVFWVGVLVPAGERGQSVEGTEVAMIIAASSTAMRTGADGPSAVVQWR